MVTNKCTSFAGRFDGHAGVWLQYGEYCPMQHIQGFTQSLWMLPLSDYLLHIAPAVARIPCKQGQ
jgi:hypothetical protein